MNPCQKPSQRRLQNPAHRAAFEWLDAALAENPPFDNREKIRRMREAYFAGVDEFWKSKKIILPKP